MSDAELATKYRFNILELNKKQNDNYASPKELRNNARADMRDEAGILHEVGHMMGIIDHYDTRKIRSDGSFGPARGFENGFEEDLFGGPNGTKINYGHITEMMEKMRKGFNDPVSAPSGRIPKSNIIAPKGGYKPRNIDFPAADKIIPYVKRKEHQERRFIPKDE